jgi:hypothetical protein
MVETDKNEKMLFEITDDYYIIESWALELVPGLLLLLALTYFGFKPDGVFFELLAFPIAVYGIAKSLVKTYKFYVHKDKKIQFFPSKIVRTHDNLVIKKEDLLEVHKLSYFSVHRRYSKLNPLNKPKKIFISTD